MKRESVYSILLEKTNEAKNEFDLRMIFMFLLSHRDSKDDKIQKNLLNILVSEVDLLTDMHLKHFNLHTGFMELERVIERCKKYDKKLTIRQTLNYLRDAISNPNSKFLFHKNIVIYHEVDTEKHIGFAFDVSYEELKTFITFCLNKLNELKNKLNKLNEFRIEFNKIYSYNSPGTNAVKSSSYSCCLGGYYINEKFEEILIIVEDSYSSRNDYCHYYHIEKKELLKEFPLVLKSERKLSPIGEISRSRENINITNE